VNEIFGFYHPLPSSDADRGPRTVRRSDPFRSLGLTINVRLSEKPARPRAPADRASNSTNPRGDAQIHRPRGPPWGAVLPISS